ncbi:MAG: hypothetical protein ACT4O4_07670 [Nitrospiraceae bacterium]
MAISRMLLFGLSLSVVFLVWPPSSLAEMCQDEMNRIYKQVELLDLMDNTSNQPKQASVSGKAQEFINKSLPPFKEKCPMSSGSIVNLENGKYLRDLAAAREKRKKAFGDIQFVGSTAGQDEDLEDLEIQR